jgi:hypothetical protein
MSSINRASAAAEENAKDGLGSEKPMPGNTVPKETPSDPAVEAPVTED